MYREHMKEPRKVYIDERRPERPTGLLTGSIKASKPHSVCQRISLLGHKRYLKGQQEVTVGARKDESIPPLLSINRQYEFDMQIPL